MTATAEAAPTRGGIVQIALDHPVAAALAIFAASRIVVWLGVIFADQVVATQVGAGFWQVGEAWYHRLLRWDAGWYLRIARRGYEVGASPAVEGPIVFFPLLPLLAKAVAGLTGLRIFDAMLLVANAAGLAAAGLLAALVRPLFGAASAIRAATLLAVLPTSVFLSSAYTEPLALALVLAAFIALDKGRFMAAALACGLATSARSASVALVPVVMAQAALASSLPWARRTAMVAVLGALATSGLLAFMGWQGWVFGDPFAFAKGQQAWSGDAGLATRLLRAVTLRPLVPFSPDGAWLVVCAALVLAGARRVPWSWTLYGILALAIPYVSLGTGGAGLSSMPRFALMVFPAVVALALVLDGRPKLTATVVLAGAMQLFVTTARFSQWHWAG